MRFSLYTLTCSVVLIFLSGCNQDSKSEVPKVVQNVVPSIAVVTPQFGTFSTQILATASIQPSPDGIVSITTPVAGTVSAIHVAVGDKISTKSSLITIRSSDVSDVNSNEVAAKATYVQVKHTYEMNKELFKLGAITDNDLSLSKSNFEQAEAAMRGYSQKLAYMGASSNQTLDLHSSISGVVYEIGTHLGEHVMNDATQSLIKIINTNKKIVVASVYEKDISAFYVGKEVSIKIDNTEHSAIKGKVTYISDVQDPDNKTTKVYIQPVVNSSDLRINMFANVIASVAIKDVYRIPDKSIIFKDGKFIVFVKKGDQFSPLNITVVSDDSANHFSLVRGIATNAQIALEPIALEKE